MMLLGIVAAFSFRAQQIVNPRFESGLSGWTKATYGAEPTVTIEPQQGHANSPALHISSSQPTDTAFGQDIQVRPGTLYRLSAWIKTASIDPHGAPVFGTLQAQLPAGASILATGHNHAGDTPWTRESVYFTGPADGRARVALFLAGWGKGSGSVWFSDCQLEPLKAEDLPMRITTNPLCPGRISPMQYGQFIEYLCDLVPSMWAEKLYDTSFEGLTPYKFRFIAETDFKEKPWYPYGQVNRLKVEPDRSTQISGTVSKHLTLTAGEAGIAQDGIALNKGKKCRFSIYVKGSNAGQIQVRLFHNTATFAAAALPITQTWQKVEATLAPSATTDEATLSITTKGPAEIWLDNASLMPEDTVGGWRPDVVKALTALKPSIIRIGGSVLDDANLGSFEWTDTIGNPDHRKPFQAWGGLQPTGAGLEEVVQLIQAVKAEPLICVRFEKKTPKDAADEVEYFNGSIDTPMGALRAKNGRPKPYGIKYWQVGNERWGEAYWSAVPAFCQAMLAVDPHIKLLSSFPSEPLIKGAAPYLSYVSPHQYEVENLGGTRQELEDTRRMIQENAGGKNLKLAVTEWNTTAGDIGLPRAKLWTLKNALDCSRYQNLLHREADLVEIANRSNLTNSFCSGIIQTNRSSLFLTPTYYAQFLYANLAGSRPLKIESDLPADVSPDTSATLSEDGKWLTLFAINSTHTEVKRHLDLSVFNLESPQAEVWTLTDTQHALEPDAVNSFTAPERIVPLKTTITPTSEKFNYTFPPLSLIVLRFHLKA